LIPDASPFKKFVSVFKNVEKPSHSSYRIENLFRRFAPNANLDPNTLANKYQNDLRGINNRYPLLTRLNSSRVHAADVAEYVNLIDAKKGVE
jgi:hypothetical protein